jgi:hypothetical protein
MITKRDGTAARKAKTQSRAGMRSWGDLFVAGKRRKARGMRKNR